MIILSLPGGRTVGFSETNFELDGLEVTHPVHQIFGAAPCG